MLAITASAAMLADRLASAFLALCAPAIVLAYPLASALFAHVGYAAVLAKVLPPSVSHPPPLEPASLQCDLLVLHHRCLAVGTRHSCGIAACSESKTTQHRSDRRVTRIAAWCVGSVGTLNPGASECVHGRTLTRTTASSETIELFRRASAKHRLDIAP